MQGIGHTRLSDGGQHTSGARLWPRPTVSCSGLGPVQKLVPPEQCNKNFLGHVECLRPLKTREAAAEGVGVHSCEMGRVPCCERDSVKRGQWTPEEDNKLAAYIAQHGTRNWRLIPKNAGLQRCGKSCRLRWTNYLRPDLKHGEFSEVEEQTIVKLHSVLGNRWSLIAGQLPGRTDNDVKNHWNTKLKKKLSGMGIDPVTHKPFSHLIAEITTTLAPPQVTHLAEAALGCFKDEVLHLLTRKRVDSAALPLVAAPPPAADAIPGLYCPGARAAGANVFGYGAASSYCDDIEGSAWSQSVCTESTCTAAAAHARGAGVAMKGEEDGGEVMEGGGRTEGGGEGSGAAVFGDDCIMWDLSDDLMDAIA